MLTFMTTSQNLGKTFAAFAAFQNDAECSAQELARHTLSRKQTTMKVIFVT
ncbi:hypothetical protein [uncultured Mailhella sp.]|uniref:hypothetical protein n=1 Tax=uncultured Mailhella sp. TaxID=1981031 RepID=UPI0025FF5C79|nr:hypothetical protein [uncultured Mailhella sp.]